MMSKTRIALVALVALAAAACSSSSRPRGPRALFRLAAPGEAVSWDALPFPNDLFLGADGTLNLKDVPIKSEGAFRPMVLETLNKIDGFGTTTGIFFTFDEELDPNALPRTAAATTAQESPLFLVDIEDPVSPRYGRRIPLVINYYGPDKRLALIPRPGRPLRERNRYALVLTRALRGKSGDPLQPSDEFLAFRDAAAKPGDAKLGRAWEIYKPLFDYLAQAGMSRQEVSAATVFTTQSITRTLKDIRQIVKALPAPGASVLEIYPNANSTLEYIFGTPTANLPGRDNAGGIIHGNISHLIHGTMGMPNFLSHEPPKTGLIKLDGNGKPVIKSTEKVYFTLTLPKGRPLNNLPVIICQHGLNDTRAVALLFADTFAAQGFATIAIDFPYHGSRQFQAVDKKNNLNGSLNPDYIGDSSGPTPSMNFFGIYGVGEVPQFHPFATRDNAQQSASDLMTLVKFIKEGNLDKIRQARPELNDLSFRDSPISFYGMSFGAILGSLFLAVEPDIKSGVLVVGGGGFIFPLLLNSPTYDITFTLILFGQVGQRYDLIDYAVRHPMFYPEVNLFQMSIDPGDPLNFARHIIQEPFLSGDSPKNILMIEAYNDESVPNHCTEALAEAMGVPALKGPAWAPDIRYAELDQAMAPVSGNISIGGKSYTAGLFQYDPASHEVAANRRDKRTIEPGFPPFNYWDRNDWVPFENPVDAVHQQLTRFYADTLAGTPPTILDRR